MWSGTGSKVAQKLAKRAFLGGWGDSAVFPHPVGRNWPQMLLQNHFCDIWFQLSDPCTSPFLSYYQEVSGFIFAGRVIEQRSEWKGHTRGVCDSAKFDIDLIPGPISTITESLTVSWNCQIIISCY